MDILTSVEPQLAIPVVGVVLCALLVYIFGFQKTQEPSFQHLALLQATGPSKGSRSSNLSLRQRSSTPQVKVSTKTKSVVANGHAVQEKASPKPNGTVKSPKATRDPSSNKENVRPQQQQQQQKATPKKVKIPKDAVQEDLESGEWIQAVSRKDKKERSKKEIVPNVKQTAAKEAVNVEGDNEKPVTVLRVTQEIQSSSPVKSEEETPVVPTTPKKAKDTKKKADKAPSATALVDDNSSKVAPVKVEEKVTLSAASVEKENTSAAPVKETPPNVVEAPKSSPPLDSRSNIAFDEMGDAWEEAKSARAKKRRARKD